MHILAIGINHHTAPVELREKFAVETSALPHALKALRETISVMECVIVSTCNRTEIYVVVDRMQLCGHYIRHFIEEWFGVARSEFNHHLYIYEDKEAIKHLFRVSSGLDSMVIGETQILGQVRDAFLLAQKLKTTGTIFNMLFKQAVTLAKRAHSETSIGENPVSVSYAAVELGKRIFGGFANKTVLILGAGKMSELTAKHLHAGGVGKVIVMNRTFAKAEELAAKFNGQAYPLSQLNNGLSEADIVISSTGSAGYLLEKNQVEELLHKRKAHPLFMIDIAVPRDLDPKLAEIPNVFLYDIDDLEGIVESNLQERRKEAEKIELMIESEWLHYEQWYRTLGVSPVIHALQVKANRVHEETLEQLLKKLPGLNEQEMKVIRKLTKSMVNQMTRDPILRVKEMAGGRHGDDAIDTFKHLFALEEIVSEEAAKTRQPETKPVTQDKKWPQSSNSDVRQAILTFNGQEVLAGT